jgi:hypothetical protein
MGMGRLMVWREVGWRLSGKVETLCGSINNLGGFPWTNVGKASQ